MDKETFLIIGLGNPGEKYKNTRHNVGFDVLEVLSRKLSAPINKKKSNGLVGECVYKGHRVALCKPQTYMNESGMCVSPLVQWYKTDMTRLLIVYDDIDLKQGQLRVRKAGSAGTHNGMRSIIAQLGRQDFPRVRVGIGGKPEHFELADWVLSKYRAKDMQEWVSEAYERAAECVLCYIEKGIEDAMQVYNRKDDKKAVE